MHSGRRRSSISCSRRSSLQTRSRPTRLETPKYSHINIQPAPDDEQAKVKITTEEDFICKRSAQLDIQEGTLSPELLNRISSRPRTFAEAMMSTTKMDALLRSNTADDGLRSLPSNQLSLESMGTFKYTFRKKKKPAKWSPLDLAATDTGSEFSMSDVDSRPVSPSHEPSSLAQQHDHFTSAAATTNNTIHVVDAAPVVDTDPTPTQSRFDFQTVIPGDCAVGFEDFSGTFDPELSDSESTKDRTEVALGAMARSLVCTSNLFKPGEDPFDSMEWSASLPPASCEESPPSMLPKPQAVAYTTVGSVVDPTVVPQFTAPNRIQREVAGRRRLMMPLHNRQDHYYRSLTPSLSLQNSTNYSHDQTYSPGSFTSSQQSLSARSSRSSRWKQQQQLALTNMEKQVLAVQGVASPEFCPENIQPSLGTPPAIRPYMREEAAVLPTPRVLSTAGSRPSDEYSSAAQALEKTQILQRLAKSDSPMHELSHTRLSDLSLGPPRPHSSLLNHSSCRSLSFEALLHDRKKSLLVKIDPPLSSRPVRGYQFPRPDSANATITFPNPLFRVGSPSDSSISSRPPPSTYPQPLTAGPPGQRQYLASQTGQNAAYIENLHTVEKQTSTYNSFGNAQSTSPWSKSHQDTIQAPLMQHNYADVYETANSTKCLDTLSVSDVVRYYPYGFPRDMTGKYLPLPLDVQKQMDQIADGQQDFEDMKKAIKIQELDNWFYGGQRRFYMSAEDYIGEVEHREHAANPFGPTRPSTKGCSISKARLSCSIDEMNKMSTAQAAAPLLDAVFGSLIAYVDNSAASRTYLSQFVNSPAWQIDTSEKGNCSFFGEDWGAPPKRIGRDPRYQPFVPGHESWE